MPAARVFIVEDHDPDVRAALDVLKKSGVENAQVASNAAWALHILDAIAEGSAPTPDLIIVDLALGMESGFEILRRWKSDPKLSAIPAVIWTSVGGKVEEQISEYFGVKAFVTKSEGLLALRNAIAPLITTQGTVLFIDDDPSHLEAYSHMLENAGFKALTALVTPESSDLPLPDPFDVAVLDYKLNSKLSALQVAKKLKEVRPQAPVILFTGALAMPDEMKPHAEAFVAKGESQTLVEKISSLLRRD